MVIRGGRRNTSNGQDRLATLFEPDVLLPAQFFAAFRRAAGLERERLLMLAVLEDAVDCYQKHSHSTDPRGQQLFEEAVAWVQSDDRSWLFSFENICDTLEINSDYVRRGLRQFVERKPQPRSVVPVAQVALRVDDDPAPALREATG